PGLRVHDYEILIKALGPRDHSTERVQRHAAAIKNDIVVSADLIDVNERHAVFHYLVFKHAQLHRPLSHRIRRGGDVQQQVGPALHQRLNRVGPVKPLRPEIAVVPYVLAYADAQAIAPEVEHADGEGRLKVAGFIKHVVSGEQGLVLN